MKHPILIGGITLAGLFVAYEVWGRTPGQKAKVGDTVRLSATDLQMTPALQNIFPLLSPGTTVFVLITSIDDSVSPGVITGRLVQVSFPERVVMLRSTQLFVKTTRKAVLPPPTDSNLGKLLPATSI